MRDPGLVAVPSSELVAAALLGTARRPVPPTTRGASEAALADPARLLLDLAAMNRVTGLLAPIPTDAASAEGVGSRHDEPCPAETLPPAPQPARQLLLNLLGRPEPILVNSWLNLCVRHELGVAPELWTQLARVAARNRAVNRIHLGAALGPQGLWFLRQNPEWAKLAAEARTTPTDQELPSATHDAWSEGQVDTAMILLARGDLGSSDSRRAAAAFGMRVPLEAYERLRTVVNEVLDGRLTGARALAAYDALSAIERAMFSRLEIEIAFDSTRHLERISLPDRRELAQQPPGGSA